MNTNNEIQERDPSLKALIVLSRTQHAVEEKIKEDIKTYGLNPTEFGVLELLYHKGRQPIQRIGEKILLSSGSITYVVDKLETKNYLIRKPCPKDRRVTYTEITKEGTELMDKIFPAHKKVIQEIFSTLDQKEKELLINLLKRVGLPLRP
ncbi:MarR family winged helix-turn-helix transcriptional regulator [Thalassobacillus sp. C254]|uniref:MarR family winged helix-turn-helix transcriptional regulator n=1 Tax=Thalassobacillus sp. C254 TaxID=1225341 RepID=UPI0006D05E5A|nr:MarR family transcriptional regulator [Thalassobacillus sp. C254]